MVLAPCTETRDGVVDGRLGEFLSYLRTKGVVIQESDKPRGEPVESFAFRFLYSCEYNYEFALDTVSKHIKWRRALSVEKLCLRTPKEILGCDPTEIARRFPFTEAGKDLTGRPILYYQASCIDAKGILQRTQAQRFALYQVWLRETSIERACRSADCKYQAPRPPYYLAVMDLKGIRLSQASSSFYTVVKLLVELDDWHYPARVDKILLVNAPFFFNIIWKAIRRLAYHTVDKKVEICGTSKSEIRKTLERYIDVSQIPKNYGGGAEGLGQGFVIGTTETADSTQSGAQTRKGNLCEEAATTRTVLCQQDSSKVYDEMIATIRDFDDVESLCLQERDYLRQKIAFLKVAIAQLESEAAKLVQTRSDIQTVSQPLEGDSQEALLTREIEAARSECYSSQAAIKFARNYIEQESSARMVKVTQLKSTIETYHKDNVRLANLLLARRGKAITQEKLSGLNRPIQL